MTKRTYPSILAGIEGWDAELDSWRDNLQNYPIPVPEPAAGSYGALPAASQNDRGISAVNDATAGWILVLSTGAAWAKIPKQAAAQADSTAANVTDLKTDFNALLAKLRTAGVLAP